MMLNKFADDDLGFMSQDGQHVLYFTKDVNGGSGGPGMGYAHYVEKMEAYRVSATPLSTKELRLIIQYCAELLDIAEERYQRQVEEALKAQADPDRKLAEVINFPKMEGL